MNVTPVITRELRGEARRAMNYWLRIVGAATLLALLVLLWWDWQGFTIGQGSRLFMDLNLTLFAAIWLIVPLLTADCISFEKREGTLGLLFLTPLTARDIVIAKGLVHALRALTLWLAALPVLAIPLLLGGVTWMDLVRAALLDCGALVLALTTGLLASCWCREWSRALMLALSLSLLSGLLFVSLHTGYWVARFMTVTKSRFSVGAFLTMLAARLENQLGSLPFFSWGRGPGFSMMWRRGGGGSDLTSVVLAAALLLFALLAAVLVLWLAVRRIRRAWQEEPPSPRQRWWMQAFCTPQFWRGLFRRYLRRSLERNPIGWLQEYSWNARLSKWGWCLGIVLAECALFVGTSFGSYLDFQTLLGALLALGIALSAAGSFRRERQTGALELILVTPLRVRAIILGRLVGLWNQFLPTVIVVLGIWLYLVETRQALRGNWALNPRGGYHFAFWLASTYLTLPMIGLYFSMRPRHIILNWLSTCVAGLLAPVVVAGCFSYVMFVSPHGPGADAPTGFLVLFLFGQCALAAGAWLLLTRNLEQRTFTVKPAGT
ncbi:MAG: hypothetical protein HYY24_05855 [Verrucomicrobia bacterium]|nr:hypothetical protein [Verrucomicrobiota bacterium]